MRDVVESKSYVSLRCGSCYRMPYEYERPFREQRTSGTFARVSSRQACAPSTAAVSHVSCT